jgi:hypothetical protein
LKKAGNILTGLLLICLVFTAYSQKQSYNWYFGGNAGISFSPSGSSPNPVSDGMLNSPEGCSAISDSSGNLLFYTDGATVWNKSHQVMSNGTGLNGYGTATQSCIIIPKPSDNSIYYVFTINPNNKSLYYSEIDISQNGGLGSVTMKNLALATPVSFKLTAVHQRNGYDYWVLAHGFGNNVYYAYSVTQSGVTTSPVTTAFGAQHSGGDLNATGQMKFSPDGSYLVTTLPLDKAFELSKFDNGSGRVQTTWYLGYQSRQPYGVEFSPDCKRFYVSFGDDMIQCNIEPIINNSSDSLMNLIGSGAGRFWSLQLAPDGKIYIAQNNSNYLGRINSPTQYGAAAGYTSNAVQLNSAISQKGLPAFVQSWMTMLFVPSIVVVCEGESAMLWTSLSRSNENAYFYWWGPGGFTSSEQNPIIKNTRKNQEGYYKVQASIGSMLFRDSVYVKIESPPKARIIPDGSTTLCNGDSLTLFAQPQGMQYSYYWSTGENSRSIQVNSAGRYYLTVSLGNCRSVDSIDISVVPGFTPQIVSSGPKVICEGDSMVLEALPSAGVDGYLWSTGDTTRTIIINKGGTYSVTINLKGCLRTATTHILNLPKPDTRIIADGPTSFCTGDSVILKAEPIDKENSLLWSTGETTDSIIVKSTGFVYLEIISRNGCSTRDTIEIISGSDLRVRIEPSQSKPYCMGDTITLTAHPVSPDYEYNWSSGETQPMIKVSANGTYSVSVKAPGGCSGDDSLRIEFQNKPSAKLMQGDSASICKGDSILLYPKNFEPGNQYEWSTGQKTAGIAIKNKGTYKLIVTNPNGCADSTEFTLQVNLSPIIRIISKSGSSLCVGDSAVLRVDADLSGYLFEWSTGEKSDSIIVRKSGWYYVRATNSSNCTSIDSIEARFNPYPELEIMPGNDLLLCRGDTIPLFSKAEYARYEWSTGDTTRQILVANAGNYSLTVYDTSGCQSRDEVVVRDVANLVNGIEDYEFGKIQIWVRSTQKIAFWNLGQDTIFIDSIYILRNPGAFGLEGKSRDLKLEPSKTIRDEIYFYPKDPGIYDDSIVFAFAKPCREKLFARITGVGVGLTGVGLPDTSGPIGMKNFRIPLRAKITLLDQQLLNLSYSARIRFYADIFLPSLLTNGIIKHDTIIGDERVITIEDDNVVVTTSETILTELTGTILLGSHKVTPIVIENFRWDNPLIDATVKNGSLEAISVCFDNLNLIEIGKQMNMSITPIPVNDNINVRIDNPVPGDYVLKLHTIEGIELESLKIVINESLSGKSAEFLLPVDRYSSGIYLISLEGKYNTMNNIIIKK